MTDAQFKRWFGRATSVAGLAVFLFSAFTHGTQQPTILLIAAMFAGLPVVASLDGLIRQAAVPPPPTPVTPPVPEDTVEVP
jgi:hypothetical protein